MDVDLMLKLGAALFALTIPVHEWRLNRRMDKLGL